VGIFGAGFGVERVVADGFPFIRELLFIRKNNKTFSTKVDA